MANLLSKSTLRRTAISPIGLDISPRHIRTAQLKREGDQWTVLRVSQWARRESEVGTSVSKGFAQRIRTSMRQADYHGRKVVGGLSVPEVELHALDVPTRGELGLPDKFADAVRWEMGRIMSTPNDAASTSYWRLPPCRGSQTTAIGVATHLPQVEAATELAESLGFDCIRVDATACALARLGSVVRRGFSSDPRAVWGVLDVGHRMIRLVIVLDEVPVLVRTLGRGGDWWTESVAEALGLSIEAAEVHKRDHGIGIDDAEADSIEIASMIRSVLNADLQSAVCEIERSYEYAMRCYTERSAGELILVGGGAELIGLDRYLSSRLGVGVLRLDTIAQGPSAVLRAPTSFRGSMGAFACAIGLAIEAESSG